MKCHAWLLERLGADDDVGDVAHVDGPAVARGEQQEPDVGDALQRLAGDDGELLVLSRARGRRETSGWLAAPCRRAAVSVIP